MSLLNARLGAIALVLALMLVGCRSQKHDTAIAFLAQRNGVWQVWRLSAPGAAPECLTQLTEDVVRLSWFPNGRDLLLNLQNGQLRKLDTVTKAMTPIDFPVDSVVDAVIGPDGRHVAYSVSLVDSGDRNDIWTFDISTRERKKLTMMPGLQHNPVWSADGHVLYFLAGGGPQAHDIWTVELSTGSTRQLTVGTLYHFDPAVRGDGAIAYSSNAGGDYDLWWQEPDERPVALTTDASLDAQPSWAPSGEALAFASTRDGDESQLWRYDLSTKLFTRLTQLPGGARMPEWAPAGDGR